MRSSQVGYATMSRSSAETTASAGEYRKALERTFAPEFLNRIDDIIMFRTLETADVERIIDIELKDLFTRAGKLGYRIRITDGAKRTLAGMGYEPRYGVRSLKRTLLEEVEEPLTTLIIEGKLHRGNTVVVGKSKQGVTLKVA